MPPYPLAVGGETAAAWSLSMAVVGDGSVTHEARSSRGPSKGFLANTGRCNTRGVCSKFQMLEDLPDDLAVRDGGDDPQHPTRPPDAARHGQRKDAREQPRPAPALRRCAGFWFVHTLLAWRRNDRPTQILCGARQPP